MTAPTIQQLLADASAMSAAITKFQDADADAAAKEEAASLADAAAVTAQGQRSAANAAMLDAQAQLDGDLAAFEVAQAPPK